MNANPRQRPPVNRACALLAVAGLCAAFGTGCGERDPRLEQPIQFLDQRLALEDQLLLVDTGGHRALLVDVGDERLQGAPRAVPLPFGPQLAVKRNGAEEALILCSGQRSNAEHDAEPAELAVLAPDGELRRYVLGANPFTNLAQSDDGRFVLLWKSGQAMRLLDNPNGIAIVDLSRDPEDAVTLRSLRSFGDSPLDVQFSPPMQVLGEERRLALVLSSGNVTMLDLGHLDRAETTVQLSSAAGTPVMPREAVFNPAAPEIYLRGASSSDVFVFNLEQRPDPGTDEDGLMHNDFRPFIDQLGVGGRPDAMALYDTGAGSRLLVLVGGTQAAVVDPSTSQTSMVALPATANETLLFTGVSPRDRRLAQRALLFQGGSSAIAFLDLEDLEARGGRNLEQLTLPQPVVKLIPMLEKQSALIIHQQGGVSLLDLEERTVSPITSNASLADAAFDAANGRLWVGPPHQSFVAFLDLATGDTPEIRLDANVQALVPMFGVGRVVVLHDSTEGYLTVLDTGRPSRDSARSLRGFLLAGVLSEDE